VRAPHNCPGDRLLLYNAPVNLVGRPGDRMSRRSLAELHLPAYLRSVCFRQQVSQQMMSAGSHCSLGLRVLANHATLMSPQMQRMPSE